MAVYTQIAEEELSDFLLQYNIGELKGLQQIAKGIENSNFFVVTSEGKFILTIYEKRVRSEDLPFFLDLKQHLHVNHFACPVPLLTRNGKSLSMIKGKPAAIISFLEGKEIASISSSHCYELGRAMAKMHNAAKGFKLRRANDYGLTKWETMFEELEDHADAVKAGLKQSIHHELEYLRNNWPKTLPEGVIHADLFTDNIFFINGKVSGVIDFYFACNDFLAYDIAICLNAWCFEKDGGFNITKSQKLISGYNSIRVLEAAEVEALPVLASGAAMRFLLTRLNDWVHHDENALLTPKDPLEYMQKLLFHKGLDHVAAYGVYAYG